MVSDETAAKMKEHHAKESDAARLHPLLPLGEKAAAEHKRKEASAEALNNAMRIGDDDRMREEDGENDTVDILGEQDPARLSPVREEHGLGRGNAVVSGLGRKVTTRDGRSASLITLQKTQSGRGRRMPGQSAPGPSLEEVQSRTSVGVGGQGLERTGTRNGLERMGTRLSRVQSSESGEDSAIFKGDYDQEAQIGR